MSHRGSQWLVFACVAIVQFMVILDVTVINVALPAIKAQLHFGNAAIGWVVTAYVLAFGGFLLFGGRAADLFGRRRMLLTGMAAFTACSFLAGISPDPALLIVLRGAQGLSAALMSPAALSIVLATFSQGNKRNQALGYWSMVATAGAAAGLLLGGVLTEYAGWRWNFFINVPVGVVMSVVIGRVVPAYGPGETRATLDVPGAALVTAGLMAAVFYFTQAPAWGWLDARTLPALAGALVLLGLFVVNERRAEQPLVPLAIFRNRNVSGANAAMAAVYGGNLGMFFLITLYLQLVEHYSAVGTGLAILPVPVVMGPVAAQMRRLIARHGPRRYLILGPALVTAGMAWACFLPVHGNYLLHLLPALLVMLAGYGMSYPSAYAAATAGVPARQAGLASGLISTAQQMGGAIGLAVISAVAASYTASVTGESGRRALASGYNVAMAVAAVLTLLASVVAATVIRSAAHRRQENQPQDHNVRRQSYASSAGGSS
ncbi:MAG TPA: MFS transporter [Streptosporangiaceae bacterium]|nr:MFS transporter [Streptosporangiaceae bacterium]